VKFLGMGLAMMFVRKWFDQIDGVGIDCGCPPQGWGPYPRQFLISHKNQYLLFTNPNSKNKIREIKLFILFYFLLYFLGFGFFFFFRKKKILFIFVYLANESSSRPSLGLISKRVKLKHNNVFMNNDA
jgi:hypothetical protein